MLVFSNLIWNFKKNSDGVFESELNPNSQFKNKQISDIFYKVLDETNIIEIICKGLEHEK